MPIRALRICHHCAVPLTADEMLHYVFECHICVMADHDLEAAVARDPDHPEASRLADRAVESLSGGRSAQRRASPRRRAA